MFSFWTVLSSTLNSTLHFRIFLSVNTFCTQNLKYLVKKYAFWDTSHVYLLFRFTLFLTRLLDLLMSLYCWLYIGDLSISAGPLTLGWPLRVIVAWLEEPVDSGSFDGKGKERKGKIQCLGSSPSFPFSLEVSICPCVRLYMSPTFCLIVSPCRVMQGGLGQCDSEL